MYFFNTTTAEYSKCALAAMRYAFQRPQVKVQEFIRNSILLNVDCITEDYKERMISETYAALDNDQISNKEAKVFWGTFPALLRVQEPDEPVDFTEPTIAGYTTVNNFWIFLLSAMRYDRKMLSTEQNVLTPAEYASIIERSYMIMDIKWIDNFNRDLEKASDAWNIVRDAVDRAEKARDGVDAEVLADLEG